MTRVARAARLVAALALAAGAFGCAPATPPIQLSAAWPARAGEYRAMTRAWTRHATERAEGGASGPAFEQTLDVHATFKSPEWRAAHVRFRADRLDLPPSEVAALTEREKKEDADHYEVMLLVATYDPRINELQKGARSIWRVALVDDRGAEVVASEIKRDRRPRSEIAAEYPHLGDFHEPYVARFPRSVDLLRPGARRFSLKVTSSQVGVTMTWDAPAGQATAAR